MWRTSCVRGWASKSPRLISVGGIHTMTKVVAVEPPGPRDPAGTALLGNGPNPFISMTSVQFTLARPGDVRLEVYDLLGRQVATRDYGHQPAGTSHVIFRAEGLKSGLYSYRLRVLEDGGGPATTMAGRMLITR